VRQPAQHRDPLPDRVRARGQPLVRQRLPAGKGGHRFRRQQRTERRGQVLGLAGGRGHGEHEAAAALRRGVTLGDQRRQQGAQRGRGDQVALGCVGLAGLAVDSGTELGIFGYGGE
jgi:hypothetical protein